MTPQTRDKNASRYRRSLTLLDGNGDGCGGGSTNGNYSSCNNEPGNWNDSDGSGSGGSDNNSDLSVTFD
ncbi:hypothetical protein E2C01_070952 [Portunus trituberculatus]|uniref:Uncharacterized protein n=1 Tax=Portunus trituberculatus TaxID=210409 RepID=A0A5B7I307_PORTR|nr:hypothetical protein [Portunus trituberculatus]